MTRAVRLRALARRVRGAALARRLRRALHLRVLRASAWLWRRLMWRTTVVALTGSVGKTTTKECLAAILDAKAPTHKTRNNQNDAYGLPRTLLRLRPWHRYAVIEIGAVEPGLLRRDARLARPDIGIVLAVAATHTDRFATLEDTAAEKAQLLAALPRRGLAVLNADDPRVRGMAAPCPTRTFGQGPGADLRGSEVSARWPARLSLQVDAGAESQRVETRLVGAHWTNSVLAALLAARELGVPLAAAAAALARVEPFMARMQPVRLPNGAVVLRDELNASPDAWRVALAVLREAEAPRRVLVTGDVSDSRAKPRDRFRALGELAAEHFDAALFVGEHAHHAVKRAVALGMDPGSVRSAIDARAAAAQLGPLLREGDLVLLKGRTTQHLTRLLFAQLGGIGCWKSRCRKQIACDVCPELRAERALPRFEDEPIGARAGRDSG